MSDHNFEKQVQQKLDELKIPPADTVWSSIEAQIRKDKRRRRGLILFPILFLLLGVGCYFIFPNAIFSPNAKAKESSSANSNPENTRNNNTQNDNIEDSKSVQDISVQSQPGVDINKTGQSITTKNAQEMPPNNVKKSEKAIDRKNDLDNETIASSKTDNKHVASRIVNSGKYPYNVPVKQIKIEKRDHDKQLAGDDHIKKNQSETIDQKQQKNEIAKDDKEVPLVTDFKSGEIIEAIADNRVHDSINNILKNTRVDSLLSEILVEKKKATEKKSTQPDWKWGLDASAGISNLIDGGFFNGVLGGQKSLVADVSSNSAGNTPPAIIHSPSALEKGFSFSLGAFIQKSISKKFSISTGIRYSRYSTNIQVGNQINNGAVVQVENAFGSLNVDRYYRSDPSAFSRQKYTNRFHFIGLPVSIHTRLNRSKHLPLVLNTGMSLAYLVSTNALHFDGQTGVYYKDNDLFNKFQASLSAGVALSLFNASRTPVQVGPHFEYGFTNLMKREVSASKHLFYFGLNTRIFLRK